MTYLRKPRSAALLFVVTVMALLAGRYGASGILNPDFHWHILNGQWMLEHHVLPTVDYLSWTMNGTPYRLTQWAGELVMAAGWDAGGDAGTRTFTVIVGGALAYVLYRIARDASGEGTFSILIVTLLAGGVLYSLYARPQILSFLALSAFVFLTEQWRRTGRLVSLSLLPAVMILWVNFHGAFVLGMLYLCVAFASIAAEKFVDRAHKPDFKLLLPLAAAIPAVAAASLVNPYGIGAWESVIEIARSPLTTGKMFDEWTSPSMSSFEGMSFIGGIVLFALSAGFSRLRLSLSEAIVFLAFLLLAFDAKRNVPYFLITTLPVVARLSVATPLVERFRDELAGGLALWKQGLAMLMLVPISFLTFASSAAGTHKLFPYVYSTPALDYVSQHGLGSRLMHNGHNGGYLAFSYPGMLDFTDSRADLFPPEMIIGFWNAEKGKPGWQEFIDKWHPTAILLPAASPLAVLLPATSDYAVAWQGGDDVVLAPKALLASAAHH